MQNPDQDDDAKMEAPLEALDEGDACDPADDIDGETLRRMLHQRIKDRRINAGPTQDSIQGEPPKPLKRVPCSTACCITPKSPSSKAPATACARASRKPRPAAGERNDLRRSRRRLLRGLRHYALSRNARHAHARQRLRPVAGAEPSSGRCAAGNRRNCAAAWLTAPPGPSHRRPRLSPIRSLAYFRPVIEELQENPALENYREYLEIKLRKV